MLTVEQFAKVFDMAVLKQNTQEAAIREGCQVAKAYNLAAFFKLKDKKVDKNIQACYHMYIQVYIVK
ncbi:MAG: hypothetical protein CVV02_05875 [Firmicutes bacterium HGW-Firmicutes-7]|nr:MAG: hypothetical protein CVV02_05875 [Firmicutes bacterium HGW-Firmicutes-7]